MTTAPLQGHQGLMGLRMVAWGCWMWGGARDVPGASLISKRAGAMPRLLGSVCRALPRGLGSSPHEHTGRAQVGCFAPLGRALPKPSPQYRPAWPYLERGSR